MEERSRGLKEERRLFRRIEANFPVKMLDLVSGKEIEARALDLSAQGLGAMIKEKIEVPSLVRLWLHFPDRKRALSMGGKVVWVKFSSPEVYRLGIEFSQPNFLGLSRVFRT